MEEYNVCARRSGTRNGRRDCDCLDLAVPRTGQSDPGSWIEREIVSGMASRRLGKSTVQRSQTAAIGLPGRRIMLINPIFRRNFRGGSLACLLVPVEQPARAYPFAYSPVLKM